MQSRALLYIVQNNQLYEYLAFAKALRTEVVGINHLTFDHLSGDPNIVVDIDLRSTSAMRKLVPLLAKRGTGCRIFIVDPAQPEADVKARKLGADKLLPLRSNPEVVHAALREHFQFSGLPEVIRSVDAGIAALDGGFRSLLHDEIFDTAGAEAASAQIIDAIDSAGVDDWIATVRGYHVGTFQHCLLVTATASSFARKLGMRRSDVVKLTLAALIHDIGKSAISLAILDKNGPLTAEEMAVMRNHPIIGHDYLAKRSRVAADALGSVRWHHEYLDGSGYPDGLHGDEIDDITRIITVCDVYSALIERRAYKPTIEPQQALGVLDSMVAAGKLEKPLVREFRRIVHEADGCDCADRRGPRTANR